MINSSKSNIAKFIPRTAKQYSPVPYPDIVLENGYIVWKGGDKQSPTRIARAIWIKSIQTDLDDDTVTYILAFHYNGREVNVEVSRGELTKQKLPQLLNRGADTFDENIHDVIRHLRNQESVAPQRNVHKTVGWGTFQDQVVFKHEQVVGVDSEYTGPLLLLAGNFEKWAEMVRAEVLGHVPLEAALVLGASAVVVGFVGEEGGQGSLVAHFAGDSSLGKTTAAMLAASIGGSPDSRSTGLLSTWNSTRNAMMGKLRSNYGLPIVFDEASMAGLKDFSNVIYTLAEGQEKARMTKELELKEVSSWCTTILSTGEHGLLSKSNRNTGLRVRILEFSSVSWTKNARNAEEIKDVALQNYGHAAPRLAEHLVGLGKDEISKRLELWRRKILDRFDSSDRFGPRMSLKLSLLMATAELIVEVLGFELNVDSLLDFFVSHEQESLEDRDISKQAYQYLLEQVALNHHRFSLNYGQLTRGITNFEVVSQEHWGRLDRLQDGGRELSIIKSAFTQILTEGGFEEPRIILRRWKEEGKLNCEADRLTRKRKLSPTSPVLDLYVITIPKGDTELLDEESSQTPGGETGKTRSNLTKRDVKTPSE